MMIIITRLGFQTDYKDEVGDLANVSVLNFHFLV